MKTTIRRAFVDTRRRFARDCNRNEVRENLGANIRRLVRDLASNNRSQIALYRPRQDEADFSLPGNLTDFFFPRIDGEDLRFFRPQSAESMAPGRFGIEEPLAESSESLKYDEPILAFCPAVAVDAEGVRLGLGKGYYDRFFHHLPRALQVRVGVIFQIQFSTAPLPVDPWDQALDWIVTEKMILRTSSERRSA